MSVAWFDELPSTQDEAHRLAASGAPHGAAVAARVQTAGRGTRGRAWISGAGGLWLSVVCRPDPIPAVETIGIRVGLALADYLDPMLAPPATLALKPPNDLMLGAGKAGGVLAEARWHGEKLGWVVIGVGLNLHNPVPSGLKPPAVRLGDAGLAATARELADPIAAVVSAAAMTGSPLSPAELAGFEARDWMRGRGPG